MAEAPSWETLLNVNRRKKQTPDPDTDPTIKDRRTQGERDYDRVLFSAPVRRLADKTQVFPLERHDSVRTRLTHSHEVSNLARSIGMGLVHDDKIGQTVTNAERDIPSILAAVGLAHDLGNPPFGHQGETAIQGWFKNNIDQFSSKTKGHLETSLLNDFTIFEGNAQTLRVVTRLQLLDNQYGLDLSYATLAALMKYTTDSTKANKKTDIVAKKKPGYFKSEEQVAMSILSAVGLGLEKRHPLAYIMEACDDIAYSVLDVEDAVKKQIISFQDVTAFLGNSKDETTLRILAATNQKHEDYRNRNPDLSPAELGDISIQRFRVFAIGAMVSSVHKVFIENKESLIRGEFPTSLIKVGNTKELVQLLKDFATVRAYNHRTVLEIELTGYNTLHELMDMLWLGIIDRESFDIPASPRVSPFGKYVYSRISENYRRVFEDPKNNLKTAYKEAQLLTDMVAGMTDGYAVELHKELKTYCGREFANYFKNKKHERIIS